MKKIFLILFFIILSQNLYASNTNKVYFAGGCFWCMEESFDKVDGVIETISGYSGGHIKNPKYKDVVKNTTGLAKIKIVSFRTRKGCIRLALDPHSGFFQTALIKKEEPFSCWKIYFVYFVEVSAV